MWFAGSSSGAEPWRLGYCVVLCSSVRSCKKVKADTLVRNLPDAALPGKKSGNSRSRPALWLPKFDTSIDLADESTQTTVGDRGWRAGWLAGGLAGWLDAQYIHLAKQEMARSSR